MATRKRLATTAACFALLALGGCEKARLDEQVRALCAKDGGVKVYETVTLPAEKFDRWGVVDFYRPSEGVNALGPDYLFKRDTFFYRKGNPQMSRTHFEIVRRIDGKVLGETVIYGRGGGDLLPLPMRDSSFHCPDLSVANEVQLIRMIFVRS